MELVTIDEIHSATAAVRSLASRTPLLPTGWAEGLWLKPESLQTVGAFKIRGAANALARAPEGAGGVITHSSGNHGRALGYAAAAQAMACVIVVPDTAPRLKIDAMRDTGAELVVVPAAQRESTAQRLCAQRELRLIPPYDHRDVIAGQGTVGLEILSDSDNIDTVVVPVGGGGLVSGVAVAVKSLRPNVKVIGVEPDLAADAAASLHAGRLTTWPESDRYRTIADGVRTGLSDLTFAHIAAGVDDIVTVTEEEIGCAVRSLALGSHLIAEPSGALSVAAFIRHGNDWGKTAAVISGGNIDPALLARLLSDSGAS